MAINRVNHDKSNPYVQVNKSILNAGLSAKAVGLWFYAFSRPDDWQFYTKEIAAHFKDGPKAIRSGLEELEKAGYLVRRQPRLEGGKFGQISYDWYEVPHTIKKSSPEAQKRHAAKRDPANGALLKKERNQAKTQHNTTPQPPQGGDDENLSVPHEKPGHPPPDPGGTAPSSPPPSSPHGGSSSSTPPPSENTNCMTHWPDPSWRGIAKHKLPVLEIYQHHCTTPAGRDKFTGPYEVQINADLILGICNEHMHNACGHWIKLVLEHQGYNQSLIKEALDTKRPQVLAALAYHWVRERAQTLENPGGALRNSIRQGDRFDWDKNKADAWRKNPIMRDR